MKDDSRKVIKGDTYISLTNNSKYVEDAILNGASKVIVESGLYSVDTLIVDDARSYLSEYLDELYSEEFKKIKLIGVTGTNGKTTTCYLFWSILNKLGIKCAYIGTIGFYIEDKIKDLSNTTPDMLDLYNMIHEAINNGCEYLIMEVSSHALSYGRLGKLKFEYAIFTNLTQDHLDYHKNMNNYCLEKQKLFYKTKNAIVNYDDEYMSRFILDRNINTTYGFNGGDYKIELDQLDNNGSIFSLNNNTFKTNLIGKYNIYNLVVSLILLEKEGIKYDKDILNNLDYPTGRMEVVDYGNNKIIIDYAHTPDAIKNIINTVWELKPNRVITIVGAGGDRDISKRSIMGSTATGLSSYVIFTSDNPRTENPLDIIDDIVQKLDVSNYEIIADRKKAIIKGIQMLGEFDILLVLGKGHENYQVIGHDKIPFSDIDIVKTNIKE